MRITSSSSLPVVSIVGRPNVGKSTLFNRIVGRRKVIVSDIPGTTRDISEEVVEGEGFSFVLRDTGGYFPGDEDGITERVMEKLMESMMGSDLIVFVVDGKDGLTPLDLSLLDLVRRSGKPFVVAVNKMDSKVASHNLSEFFSVSGELFPISAEHGQGIEELLDRVGEMLPAVDASCSMDPDIRVAIVGRPNVGKSLLFNRIVGFERAIVSDIPGTTRDSIDTMVERSGRKYLFVDTAGLRRKRGSAGRIERIGHIKALSSMERSDVALLVVDGSIGITDGDKKIAQTIYEKGKAIGVVVNKWDLVDPSLSREFGAFLKEALYFLGDFPFATVSALTGKRVERVFGLIEDAYSSFSKRVSTARINRFIKLIKSGKLKTPPQEFPKIYYAAQVGTKPPTFAIFSNRPDVPDNVRRFLENRIRDEFGFRGTPVRVLFRSSRSG